MAAKKTPPKKKQQKKKGLAVPVPFPWDRDDPLKMIPTVPGEFRGESRASNEALQDYVHMGSRRSLDKLIAVYDKQAADERQLKRPPTLQRSTLGGWSIHYEWQARITRLEELRRLEFEARLLDRQVDTALRDFEQASAMRDLADQILEAAPEFVTETVKHDGSRIIVTKELDGTLMVKLMEAGSKMARTALGMATEKKTVEITADFLETLPDELLELVATGKVTQEELINLARQAAEEKDDGDVQL